MSDSQQMYRTLVSALWEHIPRRVFGDIRRLMTLAWAVVGLCLTQTINFNKWGEGVISNALYAASHQRRFQRWLRNEHVKPASFYEPLLKVALGKWQATDIIYLALDTSVLPKGYVLIRSSLVYRGRAIPVSWRVFKHASATVGYEDYKPVLEQALTLLPEGIPIVLLADRGFAHAELVHFTNKKPNWHYRIRVKANTLVRFPDRRVEPIGKLCPPKGAAYFYHDVHILGEGIGPVHLALGNPIDTDEPWYVISDEPTDVTTFDEYGLRFDIEENFLDDKSNGFQVESGKLDDAKAIERLFLLIAVATLHFTSVGVGVVKLKKRRWVDTHWDRGMSYLKIGWTWLRQQFRRRWPVLTPFQLDPTPDPEPAIASRRQAAAPKRRWVVICFHPP
jgi:hypothetical protein